MGGAAEQPIKFLYAPERPSRAIKFLYASAFLPPSVWAMKHPSWAPVHKTTYAPMIYTALCVMYWAPNDTRQSARCHFTWPKKLLISRAQPPPTYPHNGYACIQNIMHEAV
jgi:hypothetical protein